MECPDCGESDRITVRPRPLWMAEGHCPDGWHVCSCQVDGCHGYWVEPPPPTFYRCDACGEPTRVVDHCGRDNNYLCGDCYIEAYPPSDDGVPYPLPF